jgi:hypothetical protein
MSERTIFPSLGNNPDPEPASPITPGAMVERVQERIAALDRELSESIGQESSLAHNKPRQFTFLRWMGHGPNLECKSSRGLLH